MADIVMADDGIAFDGVLAEGAPMGGAEAAFVGLAEALARRGHTVTIYNNCTAPLDHNGVAWRRLADGMPESADLYIANRGDRLLRHVERARRTIFWIHNPAGYLLKWRYLAKLARRRPLIVFSGPSHAATYPRWAPNGGRVVIPYGIAEIFRTAMPAAAPPPPRALFTSNPLRGLDWLLDVWERRIRPAVPRAELHVFSGPRTYGAAGARKAEAMLPVRARRRHAARRGRAARAGGQGRARSRDAGDAAFPLSRRSRRDVLRRRRRGAGHGPTGRRPGYRQPARARRRRRHRHGRARRDGVRRRGDPAARQRRAVAAPARGGAGPPARLRLAGGGGGIREAPALAKRLPALPPRSFYFRFNGIDYSAAG